MATAEIHVTLKPSLRDVQGATVLKALHQLGHDAVRDVRIGKYIVLEVDDELSGQLLQEQLDDMCHHLLSNPVIENYDITLSEEASAETAPAATAPAVVETVAVAERAPMSTAAAASTAVAEQAVAVKSLGGITVAEPFAVDYLTYTSMSMEERLALQQLAWRKHEGWIMQQLQTKNAAWVLCVGGEVVDSGNSIDTLPDEQRLDSLGRSNDLVPWVFKRVPR